MRSVFTKENHHSKDVIKVTHVLKIEGTSWDWNVTASKKMLILSGLVQHSSNRDMLSQSSNTRISKGYMSTQTVFKRIRLSGFRLHTHSFPKTELLEIAPLKLVFLSYLPFHNHSSPTAPKNGNISLSPHYVTLPQDGKGAPETENAYVPNHLGVTLSQLQLFPVFASNKTEKGSN